MGRRKAIPVVLEKINRSGKMRAVSACVSEPYWFMLVVKDGWNASGASVENFLSKVPEIFDDIIQESKTTESFSNVGARVVDAVCQAWRDTGAVRDLLFSFALLKVKKEQVESAGGHHIDYWLAGPDVALLFSDRTSEITDYKACERYAKIENMYRAAAGGDAKNMEWYAQRYAEYVERESERGSWLRDGNIGRMLFADGEAKIAVVSKDVKSIVDERMFGLEGDSDLFDRLYENGGDNSFLKDVVSTDCSRILPVAGAKQPELVIMLPYMRENMFL